MALCSRPLPAPPTHVATLSLSPGPHSRDTMPIKGLRGDRTHQQEAWSTVSGNLPDPPQPRPRRYHHSQGHCGLRTTARVSSAPRAGDCLQGLPAFLPLSPGAGASGPPPPSCITLVKRRGRSRGGRTSGRPPGRSWGHRGWGETGWGPARSRTPPNQRGLDRGGGRGPPQTVHSVSPPSPAWLSH